MAVCTQALGGGETDGGRGAVRGAVRGAGAGAGAITGAFALRDWVRAARVSRVDMVGIGDSNQAFVGIGWDHGCTKALSEAFPLFATGLHSAGENLGQSQGLGYRSGVLSTACCVPNFVYSGAPACWDRCMSADVLMFPMNYLHLPAGQVGGGPANQGMYMEAGHPLNVNARLLFEVTHGSGPEASGVFAPMIRLGQWPFSPITQMPSVTTWAESCGWARVDTEIPAGLRNMAINPRFTPWGIDMVGPCLIYTQRLINLDRPTGVSFTTLYARGSQSARDMALGFQTASDDQLTMFFSLLRARQGEVKSTLIRINTGLNDVSEPLGSLGPQQVPNGSSAAAFADNLHAIVDRLRGVWVLNGWNDSELHFLFAVSHPIATPDLDRLVEYRVAAEALAASMPRCAVVRMDVMTSADEMLSRGWYHLNGSDRYHLAQAGYETLAARELDALIVAACEPDFSGDGVVDTQDLVMILSMYGAESNPHHSCDLDGDGRVSTQDLVSFLGGFGRDCR